MKQKTFYEKKDINILSLEFSKTEHWYIHIQSFQDQRKSASKDRHFIKNSLIMSLKTIGSMFYKNILHYHPFDSSEDFKCVL